ncbi:ligase-associated DNA damage response DEXH box helicase [Luteolibacter pohnpeiensis]|uniref:Ligase-associated DNA damage response DEXH box helicase n=1 Tax=Luteolibacter pohnpeiensis TaxID=454153 RepID=A0A934SAG9_9BACT|nr:ligase-associated DNA damage response DEXH box helicase [Luteolibacter pohnpeiensis]MBK1883876.1 ligase-associated DNA damage response DEXH box helicase [Luteolibacter pohnpeiensis]
MSLRELRPFFDAKGWKPFPFQKQTWRAHAEGKSGLVHAPTGLGKTLAVWLGPVAEARKNFPEKSVGCGVLWLTPLRALAQDTLRAMREPLEILAPELQVEARTGDTPSALRARLRKKLPFGLVTTPESLSLMLTHGDTRDRLANLTTVIVDEWHELLGTKRGVQTELCLARLRAWFPGLRIWGLSATLGNLDEARDVLLGNASDHAVTISADLKKQIEIETLIPREIERFPWAGHIGTRLATQVVRELEKARTTLLFTNTRSQTEIWFQALLELKPDWADQLAMHHGSLDRAERERVENGLRDGTLRCVVCTASLDLGVDFSPVDQVMQVGSPKGIARLLQRAGRSGHQPGKTSRILGVPTHAMELVEFAAARDAAKARHIETRVPLRKPLDVLVQHLVTCAIGEPFAADEMRREIQSSHAYQDLTDAEWEWCLGFISTGGKALTAYDRYRKARLLDGRYVVDGKQLIQQHRLSIGTISADSHMTVRLANGKTLGTVEEGFVDRLKPGSQFVFAGRRLVLVRIHQRIATVKMATKQAKGVVAIWGGNKMPLSNELAHAMAARLRGEGGRSVEMGAVEPILDIQRRWSSLPDDRILLIEHAHSRDGEHLFFYPMAGRLVHEGLGALIAWRMNLTDSISVTQNDYGFCLSARRGLHLDEKIIRELLRTEYLLDDLISCMNTAEMARRQFREIARVAGLILQTPPGRPNRSQRELQSSSRLLFEVFERYDPENLLLEQSRREILEKQLEFTRLARSLEDLQQRPIHLVELDHLSPLAFPLWAESFSATMSPADAATRLEAMIDELNRAAAK